VGLEALEPDDEERVRALVAEHRMRTGSPVAGRVLDAWDPGRFVKVLPHDFKRALEEGAWSLEGAGFVTRETEGAAA
jgi:glutamate synthase (NADPH) large chain